MAVSTSCLADTGIVSSQRCRAFVASGCDFLRLGSFCRRRGNRESLPGAGRVAGAEAPDGWGSVKKLVGLKTNRSCLSFADSPPTTLRAVPPVMRRNDTNPPHAEEPPKGGLEARGSDRLRQGESVTRILLTADERRANSLHVVLWLDQRTHRNRRSGDDRDAGFDASWPGRVPVIPGPLVKPEDDR